jgi:pyruvate carboxylase
MFPGLVIMVAVKPGDQVQVGQKLAMLEAMKMEATISAESDGEVAQVHVVAGTQVETGDLLITLN